ncbi:hypothetical protein ETH_00005235 [Eimeria tenella]|uniref:Uncharacterized protein n=1 Tax=Eimeria tenella TaxID=5802 RepID=U6KGH0_EIMTE|nr:hypothetical protein ETH_00005235 [Eimeria tenella]CDJ37054.1 hypothetical protein ETH_00005235 [Eimeria tenella]|eukprot:XP_013227892.1 hypothetical protein ETH_00005235 [Eimeria tenella]
MALNTPLGFSENTCCCEPPHLFALMGNMALAPWLQNCLQGPEDYSSSSSSSSSSTSSMTAKLPQSLHVELVGPSTLSTREQTSSSSNSKTLYERFKHH